MRTLFFVSMILTSLSVSAQEKEKDTLSNWTKGGVFTLLFNQASFSNWIAGGENSDSGTVSIHYDFNYNNGDWSWDNKIITKYGLSNISGAGTRKTDDSFEFNSLLGKKAGDNWSYSLLLNIRSQFTDGFDYATSPKSVTSKFFAPGYVTVGSGMLYKKSDNFNINVSPATMKATFVSKSLTANASVFGVDQGKTSRYEIGFYASVFYKAKLMDNVTMENIFNTYSNYMEDPQNIDLNYQINFVMQINKYLSTNLNFHMIVDDNASSQIQLKQLFGLGVNYIF